MNSRMVALDATASEAHAACARESGVYGQSVSSPPALARDILIVEDESSIREMLAFTLTRRGFGCREAHNAVVAREYVAQRRPDLIVLDWMLPGMSGLEYLHQLKREAPTRDIPVLMLSARATEQDKVHALDNGADDYVTKPFVPREFVARIGALLRRAFREYKHETEVEPITIAGLTLDRVSHRVLADGRNCRLGPTEYRLLEFFMTHEGRVYGRLELLAQVWPANVRVDQRTVDVHIRRLRQALAPFGYDAFIQTVHRSGYRFSAPMARD